MIYMRPDTHCTDCGENTDRPAEGNITLCENCHEGRHGTAEIMYAPVECCICGETLGLTDDWQAIFSGREYKPVCPPCEVHPNAPKDEGN